MILVWAVAAAAFVINTLEQESSDEISKHCKANQHILNFEIRTYYCFFQKFCNFGLLERVEF